MKTRCLMFLAVSAILVTMVVPIFAAGRAAVPERGFYSSPIERSEATYIADRHAGIYKYGEQRTFYYWDKNELSDVEITRGQELVEARVLEAGDGSTNVIEILIKEGANGCLSLLLYNMEGSDVGHCTIILDNEVPTVFFSYGALTADPWLLYKRLDQRAGIATDCMFFYGTMSSFEAITPTSVISENSDHAAINQYGVDATTGVLKYAFLPKKPGTVTKIKVTHNNSDYEVTVATSLPELGFYNSATEQSMESFIAGPWPYDRYEYKVGERIYYWHEDEIGRIAFTRGENHADMQLLNGPNGIGIVELTIKDGAEGRIQFNCFDNNDEPNGWAGLDIKEAPPAPVYSGPTMYRITKILSEHGKVITSPIAASEGATVTVTLRPDAGYEQASLTVTDQEGHLLPLTALGDGKYSFRLPASNVTVAATFKKEATEIVFPYIDVPVTEYYFDAIEWAAEQGITGDITGTSFEPTAACTRARIVTFLWRATGSPEPTVANPFTDLDSGAYYYKAVLWAVEQGITKGASATIFGPDETVTRAQAVTFLHRMAGTPAAGSTDFSDVPATEYYATAVAWALEEGITIGTSDTTFSPAENCIRGQIITFLYRMLH